MKSTVKFLVVVVMVLAAQARPAEAETRAEIIVQTASARVHATTGTGASVVTHIDDNTSLISVPGMTDVQAVAAMQAKPGVLYAEPNVEYHATRTPNDPCLSSSCLTSTAQWNLAKAAFPSAWDVTTGREAITVGIVDSGVDEGHPDLIGHVTGGFNFSSDGDALDDFGHGTHVAGIVGALTNNGVGVAGGDWNAHMLSVKVLNHTGIGTATGISRGIRAATDAGVRIINLSLGASAYSQTMADAVLYAQSHGVLVIAAADNNNSNTPSYPAALPDVLSVGASTTSDTKASFSNYGNWVDIFAPGTGILSTWPRSLAPSNPYAVEDGTSMATPLVVAAASLVWSQYPQLSARGVADRLMTTADVVAGSGSQVVSGRLNVDRALRGMPNGYRFVAADGGVFSFGAAFYGSTGGQRLNKPIVSAITGGDAFGYRLVASDGGVFCYGDAGYWGSTGAQHLNSPIVASAGTVGGNGYWLVASDGGVFSFGDASFFGSMGGQFLAKPIVAIVPTVTGRGYWLVASDGGVFSFGDARFFGSTGGMHLNRPIVGAARTPNGGGYWLVASDGGIFSFGDASFYGSAGAISLRSPIVSMSLSATGDGYWLIAADGGVFSYGNAPFRGSTGGQRLNAPIVTGIA